MQRSHFLVGILLSACAPAPIVTSTSQPVARRPRALARPSTRPALERLLAAVNEEMPMRSRRNRERYHAIEALRILGDRRAVPTLIRVAMAPTKTHDFFLSKRAIVALGEIGDPRAIPALIRGLFRGSTIEGSSFEEARVALSRIGTPCIGPLLAALEGKDPELQALPKRYSFPPKMLHQQLLLVLSDLRAKRAVPRLMARLKQAKGRKPGLGAEIVALGKIGDLRALDPLISLLKDRKVHYKTRMRACSALTLLGDKRALPALLEVAQTGTIPGGYFNLREGAAFAWSRIVGAGANTGIHILNRMIKSKALRKQPQTIRTFVETRKRAQVALRCGDDARCYGKILLKRDSTLVEQEKAAIMIGIAPNGRDALGDLVRALPAREPVLRLFMLASAARIGRATDKALVAMLRALVRKERGRPAKFLGADLATANIITLMTVLRNRRRNQRGLGDAGRVEVR